MENLMKIQKIGKNVSYIPWRPLEDFLFLKAT